MRLKILRNRQGKVIATVETGSAKSVIPMPKAGKEITVREADVPDEYSSRLDAFYKEAGKKARRTPKRTR